jgi:hypothetical protein
MGWTWILAFLSLVGVVLNILENKVCFYIWFFTNATWMVIDWKKKIKAQAALMAIYVLLAVWGIWQWRMK